MTGGIRRACEESAFASRQSISSEDFPPTCRKQIEGGGAGAKNHVSTRRYGCKQSTANNSNTGTQIRAETARMHADFRRDPCCFRPICVPVLLLFAPSRQCALCCGIYLERVGLDEIDDLIHRRESKPHHCVGRAVVDGKAAAGRIHQRRAREDDIGCIAHALVLCLWPH